MAASIGSNKQEDNDGLGWGDIRLGNHAREQHDSDVEEEERKRDDPVQRLSGAQHRAMTYQDVNNWVGLQMYRSHSV